MFKKELDNNKKLGENCTGKSWAKTVQATRGSNNPTYQLTSKGTYRSHITAVVWKDGKSEKVGASSEKKVY